MEHWVEINLDAEVREQDGILLDVLVPYVRRLEKRGGLLNWHFFREPEIRFRVRVKNAASKAMEIGELSRIAGGLKKRHLISEWHFGNHGERGEAYVGEEDRYGKEGWKVAQDYFRDSAETALRLLELKKGGRLENPLWAVGRGNPWEGGENNPWREREDDPLVYHWSRIVHLSSNQLGFDMEREAQLCERQAERYRRAAKEFGMKW